MSKSDADTTQYGSYWGTSSLASEKVFYLSAAETATYIGANHSAEGLATTTSGGATGAWWLRSPSRHSTNIAGIVGVVGTVTYDFVDYTFPGVRPAFNLNLESVLFSSAAEGGKSSGIVGAAALNSVPEYTSDTARAWKVTLLDANRNFTAQAAEGTATSAATGYSNWSVDVTYNNASTGTNEYVSAMLCDASGNVLYYGKIAQSSASGTQTVNIPTGLGAGNYTLKVFSEQINADENGNIKTDYASAFQDINLKVLPKEETPSATFTATSDNGGTLAGVTTDMSYSVDGGSNWTAITGTTMAITGVTATNGVKVRDNGNGTTTSTSDVQTIPVTQAAQPTGLLQTDCSATGNDGTISNVNNTMEYKASGSNDWKSVTGSTITNLSNQTYLVRIKASGTVLASESQSITLGYKDADYSKVDAAIAKVPADLTLYTDDSVKALKDAIAAVGKDKNITEQATVDEYAAAIQKAIDGLEKKTVTADTADTADTVNTVNTADTANEGATAPRTADNSNILFWWTVLMLSAGGIVTIGMTRKKHAK